MKQITVAWGGKAYTVKEDQAFALGEEIEDIISLPQLAQMETYPKFIKLARCYAAVVNFAGGSADPEEVHAAMMAELKSGGKEAKASMLASIGGALIDMLMDGAPEADGEEEADPKKKAIA